MWKGLSRIERIAFMSTVTENEETSSKTIPGQPTRMRRYVAAFVQPVILGAAVIVLWYYITF